MRVQNSMPLRDHSKLCVRKDYQHQLLDESQWSNTSNSSLTSETSTKRKTCEEYTAHRSHKKTRHFQANSKDYVSISKSSGAQNVAVVDTSQIDLTYNTTSRALKSNPFCLDQLEQELSKARVEAQRLKRCTIDRYTTNNILEISEDSEEEVVLIGSFIKKKKCPSLKILSSYKGISSSSEAFTCAPNKSVELKKGTYVHISSVYEDEDRQVWVTGRHLVQSSAEEFAMPERPNEVVWKQTLTITQYEKGLAADNERFSVDEIVRNRQIVFTNRSYHALSLQNDADNLGCSDLNSQHGPLFCRWKWESVEFPMKTWPNPVVIRHLLAEDVRAEDRKTTAGKVINTRISNREARWLWRRKETLLGGSHKELRFIQQANGVYEEVSVKSYTFGDAFCGAGGTSRGAFDAGLKLQWAFDSCERAIRSYSGNFKRYGTDCRQQRVDEFIWDAVYRYVFVEILHISPPCQFFSAAKTHISREESLRQDEENEAALFSVKQLVEVVKPRIVTLEECAGLYERHKAHFWTLINIFTSLGYSVAWKIVECQDYGVPQKRKRLVIIASGPGEKLPPFPKATHGGPNSGLLSFVTIGDAIRNIPLAMPLHGPKIKDYDHPKAAFSEATFAKTVTCSGGENYHPSGLRSYTAQECACLQTFPLVHTFDGADGTSGTAKKQIGNAVPPLLAKTLFQHIRKFLERSDMIEEQGK